MNQMNVLLSSGDSAIGVSAGMCKPHTLLNNATISTVQIAFPLKNSCSRSKCISSALFANKLINPH